MMVVYISWYLWMVKKEVIKVISLQNHNFPSQNLDAGCRIWVRGSQKKRALWFMTTRKNLNSLLPASKRPQSNNQILNFSSPNPALEVHLFVGFIYSIFTLLETNIVPRNGWLEDQFPFGKAYFQVSLSLSLSPAPSDVPTEGARAQTNRRKHIFSQS